MKYLGILFALAACTAAQRLRILEPTTGESLLSGQSFTVELHQDVCSLHFRASYNASDNFL